MTQQQATKQLLDMGCNYLSVVDIEGNTLVPKQQNKFTEPADIKKQADKVMNYVKTAPEGTYVIEGRIGSTSKPTQIVVSKGESAPATAAAPTAAAPSRGIADPGENVLSYSAALKMQQQIAELTSENARLKDLVESLEADLADMEDGAFLCFCVKFFKFFKLFRIFDHFSFSLFIFIPSSNRLF